MNVLVRGIQQEVDDAIRSFVERRVVSRIVRFYDSEAAEILVDLVGHPVPRRDLQPECRLTLFMPGLKTLHVAESGQDLRTAIDVAGDRLSVTCRRELERVRWGEHHRFRTRERTAVRFPNSELPPNFATYPLYEEP